jgi:hypothetical protein
MFRANRLGVLGLGMATGAFLTAIALAQPKAASDEKAKAENFTAFPEIQVPMKHEVRGGRHVPVPDRDKLLARFKANHPRPIPAGATPLVKVRTAQVNEGVPYLLSALTRIEIGRYQLGEFDEIVGMAANVFRIAADLEPTAAGKRGFYQDQVAYFKGIERFTAMRVQAGNDPFHQSNLARFYRLQAETDLIAFEKSLGGG